MSKYSEIDSQAMRDFCASLFHSYGFNIYDSNIITDVLLSADFAGIESHGVQRIVRYDQEISSGCVDVKAAAHLLCETPVSAMLDGRKAMGQLTAAAAMDIACDKAQAHGFGVVTARNSNHIGICGYYAERAAARELLGICMTNTEAIAVPVFGSEGMLGTNALSCAMPAEGAPFSFDISTTVVPRGKIEVYAKNGARLPRGWAVDTDGAETTDAKLVVQNIIDKAGGGILPLGGADALHGGHKGFGLGIIVEIFTGIFSGGLTSNHVNRVKGESGICGCFIALDYGLFGSREDVEKRLSVFLQELRDSRKARGQSRIWTPGERKAEASARRRTGTIPVNAPTLEELRTIAYKQGVPFRL
ncbi:MAG: Ldh family oxidoreductase [Spirochaetaceae bacterium]|nr:Ldh family oxidoreductase [Spirochaetaceae bacterium]